MEIILGLLGLGGLSLLLQSKQLPTENDAYKALEKLDKNPADSEANTTVGMYLAFVMGNYSEGIPYFAKSSNSTLKKLAERELASIETPDDQVKTGNEWVLAASKFPSLVSLFYDRAASWYMKAWPNLKESDKAKMRIQAQRLAAPRRPGALRKILPSGWTQDALAQIKPSELDNTIARSGSYSAKIYPSNETVPDGFSGIQSARYPVKGRSFEASAFFRSNDTDTPSDRLEIVFYDNRGSFIGYRKQPVPVDVPFWNYVGIKGDVLPGASEAQLKIRIDSKQGNVWVDDASLKFNSIEDLKNGSFEEK